jgi:hypothetical protein
MDANNNAPAHGSGQSAFVDFQECLPVQHAEEVQQDNDADRHAEQPEKKIATHWLTPS